MRMNFSPELSGFWNQAQDDFDKALRAFLRAAPQTQEFRLRNPENLNDAAAYALGVDTPHNTGGKHIRPMLCLLAAHYLNAPIKAAMPFAVAIEIMHNFTLVHDDIEDDDAWRRGRPAVWKKHGLAHGINIGDYMQNLVWRSILDPAAPISDTQRVRLCTLMAETVDLTIRGQAMDINARGRRIDRDKYMEIVTLKTGYCLSAPLLAGAIVAHAEEETLTLLRRFGLVLGPLFQIRDDVIDLTAQKGRDALGADIREGKRSFLVAVAFERTSDTEARQLMTVLDKPRSETSEQDIEQCRMLFEKIGAFEEASRICSELAENVRTTIGALPTCLGAPLSEVLHYLVEREK